MGFPSVIRTWTILANAALGPSASLNAMMGSYLLDVSTFLLANGLTCKGSCNGVTGAMDGVNRWATTADTITRAANTTTANSWMAFVDGNGGNFLLSFVGGNDDICRISYSPSGVYVAAGTPAFTPTATDELVMSQNASVINVTAAATARVRFMWIDATASAYRLLLTLGTSGGDPCGCVWGIDPCDVTLQDRAISPAVWCFAYAARFGEFTIVSPLVGFPGAYSASTRGGLTRINGSAVQLGAGFQLFPATGSFAACWSNTQTELQGGAGYPIWGPPRIGSVTAGFTGLVANLVDWWSCRYSAANTARTGDTYNSLQFMAVGQGGGLLWPWDGVTTPVTGGLGSIAQPGQATGFENADAPSYASFMAGESMYVPLGNSIVTPTGPEAVKSFDRRAGSDVVRLVMRTDDPPTDLDATQLYARMIGGVPALFARYPNGDVYEVGAGGVL